MKPVPHVHAFHIQPLPLLSSLLAPLCLQVEKLHSDVTVLGLGLIVFADWYHVGTMRRMRFFDDNTRSWWTPATGGANVPALNDLLAPFGIALGDSVLAGDLSIGGERARFASGTDIHCFPAGGYLHGFLLRDTRAGERERERGGGGGGGGREEEIKRVATVLSSRGGGGVQKVQVSERSMKAASSRVLCGVMQARGRNVSCQACCSIMFPCSIIKSMVTVNGFSSFLLPIPPLHFPTPPPSLPLPPLPPSISVSFPCIRSSPQSLVSPHQATAASQCLATPTAWTAAT